MVVFLCSYLVMGPLQSSEPWEMIEYFSGTGRISRLAAKSGIPCASFEIGLDLESEQNEKSKGPFPKRSRLDFNGECGFAFLDATVFYVSFLGMSMLLQPLTRWFKFKPIQLLVQPSQFHIGYLASQPRLAVALLLQAAFQRVVVVLAPPCSTWVAINSGTSRGTILCPGGDETLLQNRKSNKLAARTGSLKWFGDSPIVPKILTTCGLLPQKVILGGKSFFVKFMYLGNPR